jgi:cytochrome P450
MTAPFKPASFNPHDPAFLANPYPTYARFREEAPVSWVTPYNTWWCFRYEDCQRILTGTDLFLKNNPVPDSGPPTPVAGVLSAMPESVFSLDNPRHDQVRPILDGLFATAIEQAVPWATALAQQLLVTAKASRQFELMNAYALPLPSGVLQRVLGVAPADFAGLTNWVTAIVAANDITAPMSVRMGGLTCSMALNAYYQALGRCPMHNPTAMFDLMRDQGMKAPQGLSLDEVQTNAVTLSIAGYYSTTFLIGTGTLNLLAHPDQLALLRRTPSLMPQAVTEMLRFDGPVQLINRYVAAATEIGGVQLKPGDVVTAVTGSANHDSSVFPDGDRFDITRTENAHQSFGAGIHYCLGAPLAERVAPVAFQVLLDQLPNLRLAGTPQWRTDPFLRAPSNLPIAYG